MKELTTGKVETDNTNLHDRQIHLLDFAMPQSGSLSYLRSPMNGEIFHCAKHNIYYQTTYRIDCINASTKNFLLVSTKS